MAQSNVFKDSPVNGLVSINGKYQNADDVRKDSLNDPSVTTGENKDDESAIRGYYENPYKGTPYEQLWNINPYSWSAYGDPSLFDKLGDFFGFRTAQDKYETERIQASREWMAQVEALRQSNEYNSPEDQSQRLQNAGLNPAISGGVNSGEGSALSRDDTPPTLGEPTQPFQVLNGFLGAIAQGVNFAQNITGISKDFSDIKRNKVGLEGDILSNESRDIQNADNIANLAVKLMDLYTSRLDIKSDGSPSFSLSNPFKDNSRNSKRYTDFSTAYEQSLKKAKTFWSDVEQYTSGKLNAGLNLSNPRFEKSENVKIVADASKIFSHAFYDSQLESLRKAKSEDTYLKKYYDKLDPEQRATLDNAQIANMITEESSSKAQLDALNKAIKFLEDKMYNAKTEIGRNAAAGSLITLYELRNRTITLPSINFSRTDKNYNSYHTHSTNYND